MKRNHRRTRMLGLALGLSLSLAPMTDALASAGETAAREGTLADGQATVSDATGLASCLGTATSVRLSRDVVCPYGLAVADDLTLDLAGHDLVLTGPSVTLVSGTVTISGGRLICTPGTAIANDGARLTLRDLEVHTASEDEAAVRTTGSGHTTIESGTFVAPSTPVAGTPENTTIRGGTFSASVADLLAPGCLEVSLDASGTVCVTSGDTGCWEEASIEVTDVVFGTQALTDNVVVRMGTKTLVEGVDYRLVYQDVQDAGTSLVHIIGIGRYAGEEATRSFDVLRRQVVLSSEDGIHISATGLAAGHTSNASTLELGRTQRGDGSWHLELASPVSDLVILDAKGRVVTHDYEVIDQVGSSLGTDVGYLALSDADVRLVGTSFPYKGVAYTGNEVVFSVTAGGVDVTRLCDITCEAARDPGTATVTVRVASSSDSDALTGASESSEGDASATVVLADGRVLAGSTTRTFEITRRPVTVAGPTLRKAVGSPDPELTATVSGVVAGEQDQIAYTLSREPGESARTYAINVSGAAEQGNYEVTFVPGSLTIYDGATRSQIVMVMPQTGSSASGGTGAGQTPRSSSASEMRPLASTADATPVTWEAIALTGAIPLSWALVRRLDGRRGRRATDGR